MLFWILTVTYIVGVLFFGLLAFLEFYKRWGGKEFVQAALVVFGWPICVPLLVTWGIFLEKWDQWRKKRSK